jgi:hypothetical protein
VLARAVTTRKFGNLLRHISLIYVAMYKLISIHVRLKRVRVKRSVGAKLLRMLSANYKMLLLQETLLMVVLISAYTTTDHIE